MCKLRDTNASLYNLEWFRSAVENNINLVSWEKNCALVSVELESEHTSAAAIVNIE